MTPPPPDPLTPETALRWLPGVGPRRAERLAGLGLHTVADLLRHLPARYEDLRHQPTIAAAADGEAVTLMGEVTQVEPTTRGPKRRPRFACTLKDDTGTLRCVWFGRTRAERLCVPGAVVVVAGTVQRWQGHRQLVNPTLETPEAAADPNRQTGVLRPVYPTTEGVPPAVMRQLQGHALTVVDALSDPLPASLRERRGWPPLGTALRAVHRPADPAHAARARDRLAYEELLWLQLAVAMRRRAARQARSAVPLQIDDALDARIRRRLRHTLTPGQEAALADIRADLERPQPMYRLLQGDVGSGKTLLAAYAMLAAVGNHAQAALLAPTEVLAEQHHATLADMLRGARVQPRLLHAGLPTAERREVEAAVTDGSCQLLVATHALLSGNLAFHRCAVLVIDEQQRFGVRQKAAAVAKGGGHPDVLVTTATPIPRTLALTLFGDLDVSELQGLPPGRRPVATYWIRRRQRERMWRKIQETVRAGERVFVVAPRIADHDDEVRSAEALATELRAHLPPSAGVGLMHGKLPRDDRVALMDDFRAGRVAVLAATTVIEVGVDVPEATLMVIEDADRFGLAQLHQLRGRVGRGDRPATCLLVADPKTPEGRTRLQTMVDTNDGFRIAEVDLELRGPGELLGLRQSGLPDLHAARLPEDVELLADARDDAAELIAADPHLAAPDHAALRAALLARFPEGGALLGVA